VVTGEVAVTLGATGEGMVAGDAVNTAARVQTAANPGTVWVDDATRGLTASAVSYTDTGEHELKGKAVPVRLFQADAVIAAVGGAQRVDGLEAPFVGRGRDLRVVKELFHATIEDGRSRLVLGAGVAGIGKSRLGWEFEKYVDGLSGIVRWHRGRCLSYGDGVAFWALAEMVRGRLGLAEGDSDDGPGIERRLAAFIADETERSWVAPRIGVLLGTETGVFPREDLFAAWTLFFERVRGDRDAVVLLFEDLQHADDGLLDFLDHVIETGRFPLFVLALARPELSERRPALGTGRRATTVHLEPLGEPAMTALVDGLVTGLPAAIRATLVSRAEGVPLYAVETVRSLIDHDAVVPQGGRYVLAGDAADRVDLNALGAPASLQALVSSRLDALDPRERALVQNAAVLGTSFTREGLDAMTIPDLDALLPGLVRKEIFQLETDPRSPERGQYRFVQGVVRQVAYDTLSRRDRKARHLAVAAHLQEEPDPGHDLAAVIARHLLDAYALSSPDDSDTDQLTTSACALLAVAAQRAMNLGSPAEALRHYTAALSLPLDQTAATWALHEGAATAALVMNATPTAQLHARLSLDGYDALGDRRSAAAAAALLAQAHIQARNLGEVLNLLEPRYTELRGDPGNDQVVLLLAEQIGRAYDYTGDHAKALTYFQPMMRLAEALEDKPRLVTALTSWATVWIIDGSPTAGLALLGRAVDLARELQLPQVLARPLINTAAFHACRDLALSLAASEESLALALQSGNKPMAALASSNLLVGFWTAGRWDEARAMIKDQADVLDASLLAFMQGLLSCASGLVPPPIPTHVTALMDSEELQTRAWSLSTAASVALGTDPAQAARLGAEAVRSYLATSDTDDDFIHHWRQAIEASAAAGDAGLVEELLDVVRTRAWGVLTPLVRLEFLRMQATYSTSNHLGREVDLRKAISDLDSFGAPYFRAQAEVVLAELLTATGEGEEAAALLDRARSTFAELGAAPWLLRAQSVLSRV
jgi:tetratricopeptide (TPR) repeat protein